VGEDNAPVDVEPGFCILAFGISAPTLAHHCIAGYDMTKPITVKGPDGKLVDMTSASATPAMATWAVPWPASRSPTAERSGTWNSRASCRRRRAGRRPPRSDSARSDPQVRHGPLTRYASLR